MTTPSKSFQRNGATVPGLLGMALMSVLLLCGAGTGTNTIENFLPQGPMQADLNAGGHSVTNAATVSGTNVVANNVINGLATSTAAAANVTNTITRAGPSTSESITYPAGSASYTNTIVLSTNGCLADDKNYINIVWPTSTNANVVVYNQSVSGSPIKSTLTSTVNGGNNTLEFHYDFANQTWKEFSKGEIPARTTDPTVLSAMKLPVNLAGGMVLVGGGDDASSLLTGSHTFTGTYDFTGAVVNFPPLQLKHGTASSLSTYVGPLAEPAWTTDTKLLYVADGSTPGGIPVFPATAVTLSGFGGGAGVATGGGTPGAGGTYSGANTIINTAGQGGFTAGSGTGGAGGSTTNPISITAGGGGSVVSGATGTGGMGGSMSVPAISIQLGGGGSVATGGAGTGGPGGYIDPNSLIFAIQSGSGGIAIGTSTSGATAGGGGYMLDGYLFYLALGNGGNSGTTGSGGSGGALALTDAFYLGTGSGGSGNGAHNGGSGGNMNNVINAYTGSGGNAGTGGDGGYGGYNGTVTLSGGGGGTGSTGAAGGNGGNGGSFNAWGGFAGNASGATPGGTGGNGGSVNVYGANASGTTSGGNGGNFNAPAQGAASGGTIDLTGAGNQSGSFGGGIFAMTSPVTVANTTSATTLIGTAYIPGDTTTTTPTFLANALVPGASYHVHAVGYYSDTGTPTATIILSLGGTTIATTGAITLGNGVSNNQWMFDGDFTCRTIGSSGTVVTQGSSTINGTMLPIVNTSTTTINTTTTDAVNLTWTWSTASTSNTATCSNLVITRIF